MKAIYLLACRYIATATSMFTWTAADEQTKDDQKAVPASRHNSTVRYVALPCSLHYNWRWPDWQNTDSHYKP